MELTFTNGINKILSNDKRSDKIKSKDDLNFNFSLSDGWKKHISVKNLLMGVGISGCNIVFSDRKFCVTSGVLMKSNLFNIEDFNRVKFVRGGFLNDKIELDGTIIGSLNKGSIDICNRISTEINSGLKEDLEKNYELGYQKIKSLESQLVDNYQNSEILIKNLTKKQGNKDKVELLSIKLKEVKQLIDKYKTYNLDECNLENLEIIFSKFSKYNYDILSLTEELKKLRTLKESQSNVLKELDKDGNGQVDVVEGNDFNSLLKKHQKSIVEIDRNYVQEFVKVSSYLKTKKENIQSIFNSIKDTPNQEVLNEYVEILKDEIHSYNLILLNSLKMIVSLVEDDMITFYEIYEVFDTLNIFDSKHEKDISQKLRNIGDGIEDLMYEVRSMGDHISNSIQELSDITEESNRQLTNQLSEIDSTMKIGNLINTINTYQNYKTNRKLN